MKTISILLPFLLACQSSYVQGDVKYYDVEEEKEAATEEQAEEIEIQDNTPDICKNDYHPIHKGGWSKEYIARYEGEEGIAKEEGLEPDFFNGIEAYRYRDVLETYNNGWFGNETHGWDSTVYVSCDYEEQSGMFLLGWNGTFRSDDTWGQYQEISAIHNPPRKYLSSEYALGYEGEWEYEQSIALNVRVSGSDYPATIALDGLYQDVGFQDITLFDGTVVEAYKLVNSFQMTENNENKEGYIEQYWVKGLGMVREIYINGADGTEILSKELSSYTGISIIE